GCHRKRCPEIPFTPRAKSIPRRDDNPRFVQQFVRKRHRCKAIRDPCPKKNGPIWFICLDTKLLEGTIKFFHPLLVNGVMRLHCRKVTCQCSGSSFLDRKELARINIAFECSQRLNHLLVPNHITNPPTGHVKTFRQRPEFH